MVEAKRKILGILTALAILSSFGGYASAAEPERACSGEQRVDYVPFAVKVGDKLPNSSVRLVSGDVAKRFRDIGGNGLKLLLFWSPTCTECVEEMKLLPEIRALIPRDKVSIISVTSWYDAEETKKTLGEESWNKVRLGLDETIECIDDYGSALIEYKVDEVPYMVLIDGDNVCQTWTVGAIEPECVGKMVERFLK